MEEEIEEKLQEIYDFPVSVKFVDFCKYEIFCKLYQGSFCLPIIYDNKFTKEANINNMVMKIDKEILNLVKKG